MRSPPVPTACAYTEAPDSLRPLMRQRTRWFAGFLMTLLRFRGLIGRPRAGDVRAREATDQGARRAVHPPLSLLSLLGMLGFDTSFVDLRPLAVSLFCLRWAWDSFTLALAVRFARRAGGEVDLGRAGSLWPWLYVLADGLSYFWLRQVAVLRAYGVALRPSKGWRSPRSSASVAAKVRRRVSCTDRVRLA